MKKITFLLIFVMLFTSMFYMQTFAAKEFSITVDGQKIDLATAHTFKDGRTMVALDSGLFEKLGAKARYDEAEGKAWIEAENSSVEFTMDDPIAYIHRKYDFTGIPQTIEMDVAPFVMNGKVFIPVRFAAESLDTLVEWDGNNNTVNISTTNNWAITPVETPVDYEEINIRQIPQESGLSEWIGANRKNQGIYHKAEDNKNYILICGGEKPTGGYKIQLDSITMVAPGSVYLTAQIVGPAPDVMVTTALTYPCMLIEIEDQDIQKVDGIINPASKDPVEVTTISDLGEAIVPEEIAGIALYNLNDEQVKTYTPEEFAAVAQAFNSAEIDDSFYIMMITGNKLSITLMDGTAIHMTSYGSDTNLVATKLGPDGQADTWHLVCPEIAGILLKTLEQK